MELGDKENAKNANVWPFDKLVIPRLIYSKDPFNPYFSIEKNVYGKVNIMKKGIEPFYQWERIV